MMYDNETDDFSQLFDSLPPEVQEMLMGMGTLDERGALLQQQMAQAEALRQPSGRQYSTGLGAALGGIGDFARQVAGTRGMDKAQGDLAALLDKKDAGRMAYAKNVLRRPQQPMAEDVVPAMPFGL